MAGIRGLRSWLALSRAWGSTRATGSIREDSASFGLLPALTDRESGAGGAMATLTICGSWELVFGGKVGYNGLGFMYDKMRYQTQKGSGEK